MNYLRFLNDELHLKAPAADAPLVLDLFAGCGGLALGFEAAGFRTQGYEMDEDPCATYNANLHGDCRRVRLEPGQGAQGWTVVRIKEHALTNPDVVIRRLARVLERRSQLV